MVVAVEKGLDEIKDYLGARGFTVCDMDERRVVDAVIFKNIGIYEIQAKSSALSSAGGKSTGVFLVNANNRTPGEIEKILTQKSYCSLF